MPGFNGAGPCGTGSMTGWRRGNCVPADSQMSEDEKKVLNEGDLNSAGNSENLSAGFSGVGRGGVPCGCGAGFCGGYGRGRSQAQGRRTFGGRRNGRRGF
ncbi:hypothetical protein [Methanolacinia paynteri]|uniref:hypothetical protein n=1 Tax=Methanolacinia paynteri TaxID=230356 RepID=UPI0012F69ACC|nr:hypothetical protein [Methanolacinia paynteri]